ncbi:beta-lactamase/transpeptidase-like protein [Corynespora cassiicola Philippines]|uniref:Beta-lactamase/transpeptidase-like protein n=1 Tax=Corynespora cassiicola Philippines TaxID=1448308 RepID=A0A2T2NYC3_CORCC|nr:beta-lactamase/transpeptidase-like protein [Corynespora cassiicola Philippines]
MPLSAESTSQIKAILDGVTSEGPTGSPGLVFVAVDKSGTLIEHAAGTRSLNSQEKMDLDTSFWIASMTKIVTTIALLQLVEQGKLSLDDEEVVKKYAPEIGKKKVYADGATPQDQKQAVTLRMLLAHTAGFGYAFTDPRIGMVTRPAGINEFSGNVKDYLESPMLNQPGSMWEYGINIDWAGIILERLTGQKLNDYFQEHIFKPLGIKSVTMFPDETMISNMAHLHQRDPNGALRERTHVYTQALRASTQEERDHIFNSGGAGLYAKPKEYAKVLSALLNDGVSAETGARILSASTVKLMWENQIPNQPNFARNAPPPADPHLQNAAPEIYPQEGDPPQGWGLSMFLTIAPGATGRGANTGWWAGLINSFWWVDRERGVAGVIAGQVLPFGDAKVVGAWGACEAAVYGGLQ